MIPKEKQVILKTLVVAILRDLDTVLQIAKLSDEEFIYTLRQITGLLNHVAKEIETELFNNGESNADERKN